MNDFIEIGYIQKPKGLKGEVFVVLYDRDTSFISKGDVLFFKNEEEIRVKSFKEYKDSYLFMFEGVLNRNESEVLKGKKLFITKKLAQSLNSEDEIFLATLLDYSFYNKDVKIGLVSGFANTKAHDILQVKTDLSETLEIPWVDEFFIRVDHENKSLYFQAPDELCDPSFLKAGKEE